MNREIEFIKLGLTDKEAKLAGAAPELLEALEGIQKSMDGFKGVTEWGRSEAADKAFRNARAAIRKAKGE